MKRAAAVVLMLMAGTGLPRPARAQVAQSGVGEVSIDAESETDQTIKRYPFRDSSVVWFQSLGAMGLVKSSELSWRPTYSWLFRLYPRYYITDKLSVRVKAGLGVEWTNSAETTTYREPLWEDIWLDLVYSPVWTIPVAKVDIVPSVRLVIPTSKDARAESQYIGLGPGFGLKRAFDLPKHMSLELSYAFRYIKYLNQYTTVQLQGSPIAGCAGMPENGDCGTVAQTGDSSVSHEFINILLADWLITKKLKTTLMVAFFNKLTYGVPNATVPVAGGETLTLGPEPVNNVSQRSSIWYMIEGSYQVHPIVSLALAVSTLNPQLAPDSTYRAPFFNRYTEFVLTTEIALDQVVANVERSVRSRHHARP